MEWVKKSKIELFGSNYQNVFFFQIRWKSSDQYMYDDIYFSTEFGKRSVNMNWPSIKQKKGIFITSGFFEFWEKYSCCLTSFTHIFLTSYLYLLRIFKQQVKRNLLVVKFGFGFHRKNLYFIHKIAEVVKIKLSMTFYISI